MAFDVSKIEDKIDKVVTGAIELGDEGAGIAIKRLIDAMEVAKLMAISAQAIPSFMRGSPGLCYAAVVRAVRWGMDPFFVAEHSYLVNNRGEEKVAYDAQLIIAVINARAPLARKLWPVYSGEGDQMACLIYGIPRGEKDPLEYGTPTLKELIAIKGRNEYGKVKGSPLYDNDPKQALWYYGARGFCRRHFPEILAGVYDKDEFEPAEPRDVTPQKETLAQRLKGQRRLTSTKGFDAGSIASNLAPAATPAPGGDDPTGPASGSPAAPSAPPEDGAAVVEVLDGGAP